MVEDVEGKRQSEKKEKNKCRIIYEYFEKKVKRLKITKDHIKMKIKITQAKKQIESLKTFTNNDCKKIYYLSLSKIVF